MSGEAVAGDVATPAGAPPTEPDQAPPPRPGSAAGRSPRPAKGPREASLDERLRAAFDPDHYLRTYPDVAAAGMDPFVHFMRHGWREGRDPAPWFSSLQYLAQAGLALGEANPLVHHLTAQGAAPPGTAPPGAAPPGTGTAATGARAEGAGPAGRASRAPPRSSSLAALGDAALGPALRRAFDARFYVARSSDPAAARQDPLEHFLLHGWREGRDPAPWFSTAFYLGEVPELRGGALDPLSHYLALGRAEGRPPAPPPRPAAPCPGPLPPEDLALVAAGMDAGFYLRANPGVAPTGIAPAAHYLTEGAARGLDPAPWFSTGFYLRRYPDIGRNGLNPFLHYLRWGRREARETRDPLPTLRQGYAPLVSVIVPSFRHAAFLPQRLESIAAQTYRNWELIVLDDASDDGSVAVIHATLARLGVEARVVVNEANGGSAFRQWRRGLGMARGELVWICESDDFCAPDFLERLVPHFADPSVMLGLGRVQFADADGSPRPGLDAYRERAEPGLWDRPLVRPAAAWFRGGFGHSNLLANVGGGLLRNRTLPDAVWERAEGMRICGDWLLYLHWAGGGQVAWEPGAVAWFRQHGANTSAANFDKPHYWRELRLVLDELIAAWGLPVERRRAFLAKVRAEWDHWRMPADGEPGDFASVFDEAAILAPRPAREHVVLAFGGFHLGGGEIFPIHLANALAAAGTRASMLALDLGTVNPAIRRLLDPGVPVYHSRHLVEAGRAAFVAQAGVTCLHSHVVGAELLLLDQGPGLPEAPLLVTLHGSHAGLEATAPALMDRLARAVDRWAYLADRNLLPLEGRGVDPSRLTKLDNAMPPDPRPPRVTRADLGIGEGEVVFLMAARGIQRKGWRAAVEAFRLLRERWGRSGARLVLAGEGPAADAARERAADLPGVHVLGYQAEVNGLLRWSDALILPSRFPGESSPLCVIQALQEGVPVVATAIGEVPAMLAAPGGGLGGLLIEPERDTDRFAAALAEAMHRLCDPGLRAGAAEAARRAGARFDMGRVAESYRVLYEDLAAERAAMRRAALALTGAGREAGREG